MQKHVLSILVENHPGVLIRIAGLFSRRGYNIDSLSVGETDDPAFSRITVATVGDDMIVEQIRKQVKKLVEVIEVIELHQDNAVYREIALIKVHASEDIRPQIVGIVGIFRANIIDVSPTSLTVEITGNQSKIDAFSKLMEPYGITELVRTGLTGIQRGSGSIRSSSALDTNN